MKENNISIGQDGAKVYHSKKKEFNLAQGLDTRFRQKSFDSEVYDFVGLVCKKDKTLVVFPKRYFPEETIDSIKTESKETEADINLLFEVIQKYTLNRNPSASK